MNDPEAKALLAAYHIPTVETRCATDPQAAARVAASIGFPVAIKGLVVQGRSGQFHVSKGRAPLYSSKAVADAAQRLIARSDSRSSEASFAGFLVQPMVNRPGACEVAIGATVDPVFGPVILFDQGGPAASLVDDTAVALPPLNLHLAWELIARTRIFRLLQGYYGHDPADIDALCLTLVKLSQLLVDLPSITEVQINPLLVDAHGVLALEACMRVTSTPWLTADRLAIRPYPQELEAAVTLKTGRVVRLRPIRPEDEPRYQAFIAKLSAEDRHFRFFGHVSEFAHAQLAYLTQIDYAREMAFVATGYNESRELEIVGEGRTVTDPDNITAECSVVVSADARRMGLGRQLMERLVEYCRRCGTEVLTGYVLRENRPMLCMAHLMGFRCEPMPDDPRACQVSLDLDRRRKRFSLPRDKVRGRAL